MKGATLVVLALAAVFAVAVGDDKMDMNISKSENSFVSADDGYKYAKSVTLTRNGNPITYTVANVDGEIILDGASIKEETVRVGYLYGTDGKYAIISSKYGGYVYDIAYGKHENKEWLYVIVKVLSNLFIRTSANFNFTGTDSGNNLYVIAINTDFNEIKTVKFECQSIPVLGTYNENLYSIGYSITSVNGVSACGQTDDCFVYDIFGESPKSLTLKQYQTGRNFYPIKSDKDDTAIAAVNPSTSGMNAYILVFKKGSNGAFTLYKEVTVGSSVATAAGEYKDGTLYALVSGGSLSVFEEDMGAYGNPTALVFATEDFASAKWVHAVPFSVPTLKYIKSSLNVLDPGHIIFSLAYNSQYVTYGKNEVFLRGLNDAVVALLGSADGELKDLKSFGYADENIYIGNGEVVSEGREFQLNVLADKINVVKHVTVGFVITSCVSGTPSNGKCLCEDGYFGDNCEKHCDLNCNHGECYFDGNDKKCACKDGYSGESCDKICNKTCGDHGVCYFDGNDMKCACTGNYTGELCNEIYSGEISKECALDCGAHGKCYLEGDSEKCACIDGYIGGYCNATFSGESGKNCTLNCSGNGLCYFNEKGDQACVCMNGYTGENCETPASSCEPLAGCNCTECARHCKADAATGTSPFFFLPF